MTEFELAIKQARELADRVRQLYFQAIESDAGLVTLKLLFPSIILPNKWEYQYRGHLGVAIAEAVVPSSANADWSLWLKRKKNTRGNFMFKFKWFGSFLVSESRHIPWSWNSDYYFVHANVEELPF